MQTIGLLLPRSSYYNTIGFDLYEGLRLGLKALDRNDIRIVSENIGFGTDKQHCYRSAEKLIMQENATVVVAYIGHATAQLLRPLFLAANRMLIVLDAGAHLPNEWPECPNIFYHSLHNTLGAWYAAKEAINDGYTSAGMITGYYDGGYLQTYSISKGFESGGGNIRFNIATGYKREDFQLSMLQEYLEEFPHSALLSIFSGDFIQWYFEELKTKVKANTTTVYLPPFGLDETVLENSDYPGNTVKGIASWSKKLKTEQNLLFIAAIESVGRTPNLFSLLSWESAHIVAKTVDLTVEHKNNITAITSALKTFVFDSPRGNVYFHTLSNTSIAPLYKATVVENNDGKCELIVGEPVTAVSENFKVISKQELNSVTSAWHNSYTCI